MNDECITCISYISSWFYRVSSLPVARPEDVARKTVAAQKEAANSRQRPKGVAALRQTSAGGTVFGIGKLTGRRIETMFVM